MSFSKSARIASIALMACLAASGRAGSAGADAVAHHATSTVSPAAQKCFDRGLTLYYAYNRLASQRAFECAATADPTFAMAFWGIALAHGTNINVEIDAAGERAAYAAIQRAAALQESASAPERAYITALATRYSNQPKPDLHALALAYADAMHRLADRYPDDFDAAALAAESAMELHAWLWYTPAGVPVERTEAIVASLERILARDRMHIGANHYYIHITEGSLHPERALMSAARLRGMQFEAGAAHLVHMPAHVYMRTGDFAAAAEVNEHASMHDLAYMHGAHEADPEASMYHDHNLTMLAAAYGNEGQWRNARRVAAMLVADGAQVPAMFVYLRFQRWNDIVEMKRPTADPNEPLRIAMWHFMRGMALTGLGRTPAAAGELKAVQQLRHALSVPALPGSNNGSDAVLAVANDVLRATLARARGQRSAWIAFLRDGVTRQDGFLYIEPPDWYASVRESLGAALFAAGNYGAAAQVFADDLRRNPRSPRALFGQAQSLSALGETAGAARVRRAFDASWKNADTSLTMRDL
jgi:hypothetical protein